MSSFASAWNNCARPVGVHSGGAYMAAKVVSMKVSLSAFAARVTVYTRPQHRTWVPRAQEHALEYMYEYRRTLGQHDR